MSRAKRNVLLDEDAADDVDFCVNPQFAAKYEEKKKKEELSILEDKYKAKLAKKGVVLAKKVSKGGDEHASEDDEESEDDSESDVVEDEDGALVTPGVEAQILKTLAEIRARNPKVYDPSVNFFSPQELTKAEAEWRSKKQHQHPQQQPQQQRQQGEKPLRLKDFHRQRLLAGDPLDEEEEEEGDQAESAPLETKTFDEEQKEVLDEFLAAAATTTTRSSGGERADDADDDDDMFKVRPRTAEEIAKEDAEYRAFLLENLAHSENARESMSEWFQSGEGGRGEEATTDERFLIDYVLSRGWVEKERKMHPSYDQIVQEDEEDANAVERMEEFEEKYNFRYEQPGGDQIVTYSRTIPGSMRREDNKRKAERAAREARKKEEKERQREELKRLKNLKRAEMEEKLRKIRAIANNDQIDVDLESDFDPEAHDQKMSQYFGDDYYGVAEGEDKPAWTASEDEEDEMGGGAVAAAALEAATKGVKRLLKKREKQARKAADASSEDPDAAKNRASKALAKYLDEYYKLDYEDKIGDLPCRFKYQRVAPTTFGLKVHDILLAEDAELNAHVSLKKLAPYRATELLRADEAKYANKKRIYKFYDLLRRRLNGDTSASSPAAGGKKRRKRAPSQ